MQFIDGGSQQEYVELTRGLDPSTCLAAGVDVGKYEALCLIADHRGEVVGEALTFPLSEPGVRSLEAMLAAASQSRVRSGCGSGRDRWALSPHRGGPTGCWRMMLSSSTPLMSKRLVPSRVHAGSRPIFVTLRRSSTWSSAEVDGRHSSVGKDGRTRRLDCFHAIPRASPWHRACG